MPDANRPYPCPHRQRQSARPYDRRRDLPILLSLWPGEIDDASYGGRSALLAKLRQALRQERKRGNAGHWSYDLARHAALRNAYRAEVLGHLALSGDSTDKKIAL